MKQWRQTLSLLLLFISVSGCQTAHHATKGDSSQNEKVIPTANQEFTPISDQAQTVFKIATWNVEHLSYPINSGCKPRTDQDINAMRSYAQNIDADIVALQEVASEQAAHLLFPKDKWRVIMSARPDSESYECRGSGRQSSQQKTAIVIKKTLPVVAIDQVQSFGLDNPGLRFGLGVSVNTSIGPIEVLNLHLKSGCFVDDYSRSDSSSCQTFSQQADILYQWIKERETASTPYIILGDFNHRISAPYNKMTQSIFAQSNKRNQAIDIATQAMIGCHPRYPAPIDHIIMGGLKSNDVSVNTDVHYFDNMQEEHMLSDHCAVSMDIHQAIYPLSSSVKWQVTSKEYQVIARAIYNYASKKLIQKDLPKTPWVAVMDLDETVLDNSQYQVNLELRNDQYSSSTWNNWVKSQKATLVPGAQHFIDTVLDQGGKLVFVTNREKSLDAYTWANMQALGLPINEQNSCLLARSSEDKNVIDANKYKNDKDLRRERVTTGKVNCFSKESSISPGWLTPHKIVMQVGDNIEDINGVTQESANVALILSRWGEDIIILPNPMYGSW